MRIAPALLILIGAVRLSAGEDYREYIRRSKDFARVRQERNQLQSGRWNHWILMPWRYRWGAKYDSALAEKMKAAGHNGGFCDHVPRGDADLHEKFGFLWYLDHSAGKGDLYLKQVTKQQRQGGNRPVCLLAPATQARLKKNLTARVGKARKYRTRVAYALDDEISWTTFTSPAKWDNHPLSRADYARWLAERYGSEKALREQWGTTGSVNWGAWQPGNQPPPNYIKRMTTPDDVRSQWNTPLDQWNLSALCDALSYMDSQFSNVVGALVTHANSIDPTTPAGFVGGQAPAPYGGYDYAKLSRKVQFLEAYDIGGSMEIFRSFNPANMIPTVKTGFGDPAKKEGVWFNWYYMVHGDRGVIAWADNWFGKKVPAPRVFNLGAAVERIATYSRILYGATWKHDGIALYYSHPSIQVSWVMDSVPHGGTWINRSSSLNNRHASTIATTWSWQKYLEDQRLQYNWLSYADVLEKGAIDPQQYRILILPKVVALSDQEAGIIRDYVEAGGVLIADNLTGIFDHHGKGRAGGKGVLDDLFGIANRPVVKKGSVFAGTVLSMYNQDTHYRTDFITAAARVLGKCKRDGNGLVLAQRDLKSFRQRRVGRGRAAHLNIDLTEYCVIRKRDFGRCKAYAKAITDLIHGAGVRPWISLSVNGRKPHITEAVYWEKAGRRIVCVVKNPIRFASEFGETRTEGISKETVKLTISFSSPKRDVRDEIAREKLGSGKTFTVGWKMDEAVILSFRN